MDVLLASRQSDLARLQAHQVGQALENQGHHVRYHFRESLGDINQDDPLWQMPEKGVFTEDFRKGLETGQWDMVVHSWKDLPIDPLPKTEIVATLPRADAHDVFLMKKNSAPVLRARPQSLQVFSSSPRRIYNLTPFFKTFLPFEVTRVEFTSVRGNILTRVRKLIEADDIHGLVVAKAALDRLLTVEGEEFTEGQEQLSNYLKQCLWQVLPLSQNPTAAAQGALAIEIKKDRNDLREILQQIHCSRTWSEATQERKVLKAHGGGCHQKIGVTVVEKDYGTIQFLRGETEQGLVLNQDLFSGADLQLRNPCPDKLIFFEREDTEFTRDSSYSGHYIARALAVPEATVFDSEELLWASGVETWKKLAERGYWVNGTSDSLGEESLQSLGPLASGRKWYRWTHDQSPEKGDKKRLATYHLRSKTEPPAIGDYTEFYWMSGSQFEKALSLEPKLLEARHFCGPGHTYTKIQELLKRNKAKGQVQALPSYKVWLQALKEYKNENPL